MTKLHAFVPWLLVLTLTGGTAWSQTSGGPETVVVHSGSATLHAMLWRPQGRGPFPAILLNHGSGRTREDLERLGPYEQNAEKLGLVFARGGKPAVGVLRSEGDGAKKSLICMLCAHEWNFRRIYCPACGEEREPQMAFYSAPEIAYVRADVCDTCHTYLKSIDLTKTGLAVPIVDELATIPLDLWARQHGYHKLQINLLGT